MPSSDAAGSKEGFNQATVDWFDPGFRLALDGAAAYDARPEDMDAFRRDGEDLKVAVEGEHQAWTVGIRR